MNIQQLESFLQVAENLNFARASEALNITQSAVSRQIRSLEEELDTKLFLRTTRTVSLTADGAIFLEHAKQILGQLKLATAKIRHHTNARVQTLAIGCESETDLDFLCGILDRCREQIPAFHPFLRVIPHRSLLNLFFQNELQVLFGFRENLPVKESFVFRELGQIPLCCVLPRDHPCAHLDAIEERALYDQEFILCNSYSIPSRAVEVQNRVIQHISPEKVHASENPRVILTLVRAGYGCSILPRVSFYDDTISYVPLKNTPLLSYGVLCHADSDDPVLRRFLDLTVAAAARGPASGEG